MNDKFLWRRWSVIVTLAVLMGGGVFGKAEARPFRPGQIPNGAVNQCSNCHFNPAGSGPRNAFGQMVEKSFLAPPADQPNAPISLWNVQWGPALAALDADGDGVTNGQELGDPNGTWKIGQPPPGSPRNVSLPGDQQSKSGNLMFTAVANVQVAREDMPAPTVSLTAALDGTQEVPAVTTTAMGTGAFVLDASGLRYRITVDGLSGPMTAAHFHNAAAGIAGGVIQPITFSGNTAVGAWALSPAMVAELLAGRIYVNVHTAANPGGEIRGQVNVASGAGLWAGLDNMQVFVAPAAVTTNPASTSPRVDNVKYPEGYQNWKLFYVMDRVDNRQIRVVYANDKAASAKLGESYPYGSIFVFESYRAESDEIGNLARDANGRLVRGELTTIFVMRKEQGFGADYGNIRNGEWEYAQYRPDKTLTAPTATANTVSCATCHLLAGEKKDFVFRQALALLPNATGAGAFWLDGKGLNYRITFSGLSGPITASHFHNAAERVSGGVVRAITFDGSTASGTWGFDDATQPLTTDLLAQLQQGRIYVNLHTAANPDGEIRGQVGMTSGVRFTAALDGSQENPPVTTNGIGTGAFSWDMNGLQYRVTVSGLSGAITASHFHNAAVGVNGGVVQPAPFTGSTSSGAWAVPVAMLKELLAGRIYFNVHTPTNGGGEIRGQLTMASGAAFWAAVSGAQENPPVNTPATGTAYVVWGANGLTYRATVDGLSGAITGSHFHSAPPGVNGGVVQPVSFTGSTTSGTVSATDAASYLASLWAGNLYFNVHTAANPGGEIRGQVILPRPGLGGLTVSFARSVSGRAPTYAWNGTTNENGRVPLNITVRDEPIFRRVGANGYYRVRLTNPTTGAILGLWFGIPLRGGRSFDILLPVGGQAAITGPFFGTPLAATKPVAALPTVTVLSGAEPLSPSISFGSAQKKREDGAVDLPVQIGGGSALFGGDLTLTYDPKSLTFRTGRIGTTEVTATVAQPGEVLLSFEGGNPAGGLLLSFDPRAGDALGNLKLTGLLYDRDLMPIGDVTAEALLNGVAPKDYALFQNYPNPFNPATTIRYALPEAGRVRLTLYNVLGQQVARLVDVRQEAGAYSVTWDARDFASGTYYYRLEAGTFREVRKLVLIK